MATGVLSPSEAIDELRRRQDGYGTGSRAAAVRTLSVLVAVLLILGGLATALLH